MKTETNPLKELRERHKEERKKARLEMDIAKTLPLSGRICIYSAKACGEFGVAYERDDWQRRTHTLSEALEILNAYRANIVTAQHWKDGCLSVSPWAAKEYTERGTLEGTSWAEIRLNAGRGYDSHELRFFIELAGRRGQVSVKLSPGYNWLPHVKHVRDSNGEIVKTETRPQALGEDSRRGWWHPPGGYHISYYWADAYNFDAWASAELAKKDGAK